MKKVFLVVMFVLMGISSNEQGASIVYDPTNGAQIANVLSTMKDLKEVSESWKANTEFLNKIIKGGKEVKRLVSLLENLVCSTEELDIYVGLTGDMALCENKMKMDIALAKIDGVSSKIQMIASGAIVLSQYETIASLKDLNNELEEAIETTSSLNSMLRRSFDRMVTNNYRSQHSEEDNGLLTNFNYN